MGRELKRVALDFDWPLRKVWKGFINPHYVAEECPICAGSGLSKQAKFLNDQWYGHVYFDPRSTGSQPLTVDTPAVRAFAERNTNYAPGFYGTGEQAIVREASRLISMWNNQWCHHLDQDDVNALWAEGRLIDFNPNWRENHFKGVPPPTAAEVNIWSINGWGHDGLNQFVCVREKCKRLGYPHLCSNCDGAGDLWPSPEAEALYENWEKEEPPTGEGYQMWETVSEGSPVSPVFADKEAFVNWLIGEGYSEGAAEQFAEVGFVLSGIMVNGRMYNNLETLNIAQDED
jgi:hypothetical protein